MGDTWGSGVFSSSPKGIVRLVSVRVGLMAQWRSPNASGGASPACGSLQICLVAGKDPVDFVPRWSKPGPDCCHKCRFVPYVGDSRERSGARAGARAVAAWSQSGAAAG